MRILAVDTTTPHGSVAVLDEDRLLAEIGIASATTHSSRLLSSIDLLLESVGLDIRGIDVRGRGCAAVALPARRVLPAGRGERDDGRA